MDGSNLLRAQSELVLTEARRQKAERTKNLGSPIELSGKALDIQIQGNYAWISENAHVARKIDLETGKTLQIFRGHTAPVTCLAFCDRVHQSNDNAFLITGSWDKSIKLWDTNTKEMISSTSAHDDFVKTLLVISGANLLISSSSDKTVRFWDISDIAESKSLTPVGSISAHTRPVETIYGELNSDGTVILFTADTMGIIKVWTLEKEADSRTRWRSTLKDTLNHHRTRVTELQYGGGNIWTASSDETVQIVSYPPNDSSVKPHSPFIHPLPVRALLPLPLTDLREPYLITGFGDVIRLYDISSIDEPEILGEIDGHWHDVTSLRLWMRTSKGEDGRTRIEPWVVSTSLDSTIRKWKLSDMLTPTPKTSQEPTSITSVSEVKGNGNWELTEEEERELAELME
ncbi:WD40-repeat-containing domain protein [Hygrophoropsis aurantiaca]|uniref:WD40-repeat-containing domain protein n=1 Tax=Hygrophoropsis aurantiaca TaxID=72124 RepID=A0ACB8AP06_9AGAM|nr:WD40-repeat-containing domain protein [Hygrophoropsis aurantiaca]